MPTEYYDDATNCPYCKRVINLDPPPKPRPNKCPYCKKSLKSTKKR